MPRLGTRVLLQFPFRPLSGFVACLRLAGRLTYGMDVRRRGCPVSLVCSWFLLVGSSLFAQQPVAYWEFESGVVETLPNGGSAATVIGGDPASIATDSANPAVGSSALQIRSGSSQAGGHLSFSGSMIGGAGAAFSICGWFRKNDIDGDGEPSENTIFEVYSDTGVRIAKMWFRPYGNGEIFCTWAAAENEFHQDREFCLGVDGGAWHHFGFVYNSSGSQLSYYIDGVLKNREQLAENAGAVRTMGGFVIGDAAARNGVANWDGYIDDVALYNVALTANQIAALATKTATPVSLPAAIPDPSRPASLPFTTGSWQFAVIPDTQKYIWQSNQNAFVFHGMADWLVAQRDILGIGFVGTVGDLTPRNNTTLWSRFRSVFDRLDDELPYVLCLGNHDTGVNGWANDRDYMPVNDYFDLTDNSKNDPVTGGTFRESYETGDDGDPRFETAFHEYVAPDGGKFLIFSLEFAPRQAVIDWAAAVCDRPEYREHTALLLVHSYVYEEDSLYEWPVKTDANGIHAGNVHTTGLAAIDDDVHDGTELWLELVSQKPQFRMVFCGSVSASDGTGYVAARNVYGDLVHQMLFDPEWRYRGGNGYMRLIEMLPGGDAAQVRSFSPYLEGLGMFPWITTPDSEFQIHLDPVFADYDGWAEEMGLAAGVGAQDPDGDGFENYSEFGLVLKPLEPSDRSVALRSTAAGGLAIDFPLRRCSAEFGLTVEVQSNTGLSPAGWQTVVGTPVSMAGQGEALYGAVDPHAEWVSVDLGSSPEPAEFYRLVFSVTTGP